MALTPFLKLAVSVKGKIIHLVSLSFNDEKKEFFYSFSFDPSKMVHTHREGTWRVERLWEHVSFHADGRIHLKYRNLKKGKEYTSIIDGNPNIFSLDEKSYFPLLFNSFHFQNAQNLEVFPQLEIDEDTFVWDLEGGKDFSFIPVIVGSKMPFSTVTTELDFLIDKSQASRFIREPLRTFNSPAELKQPPTTSSLCILFSDKVSPRESRANELLGAKFGEHLELVSLGITPPLQALKALQ